MPYPGRRTRMATRISKGLLLALLTILSFVMGIPLHPGPAIPTTGSGDSNALGSYGSQIPQSIGAGPVPDLALPHTVISSIDNLIGAGDMIQTSSDNITLYNLAVRMRLLGGPLPHDELLGPNLEVQSPWSFWQVEAIVGNSSLPLVPSSSNFTVLGTNATGTFVVRTMTVGGGPFSGTLRVAYKATSAGPLKWDLGFVPFSSGQYRLVYVWQNVSTRYELSPALSRFRVSYPSSDYTLVWNDVPGMFNTATTLVRERFALTVDLGSLTSGRGVKVDPSIVGTSTSPQATAYSFQRRVYYEPKAGNYFVFYYDGVSEGYRSWGGSGNWSSEQSMPTGWPQTTDLSAVFNGQTVVIAGGTQGSTSGITGGTVSASLYYATGTISGSSILWQNTKTVIGYSYTCSQVCRLGVRYVDVTMSSTGYAGFSFNQWLFDSFVYPSYWSNLTLVYGGGVLVAGSHAGQTSDPIPGGSGYGPLAMRSVIVPESQGRVLALYQAWTCPIIACGFDSLIAQWYDGVRNGTQQVLDSVADTDQFSAVSDPNYGVHVLYSSITSGDTTYAYQATPTSSWTFQNHIFPGTVTSTALTADDSTNDLYAFAVEGSSIAMRIKPFANDWSSAYAAVVGRKNPAFLSSNFASASSTNSSQVEIVWTEGGGPYNVTFASIPIETVWSPYSTPSDPWDGNGLAPYGQYFSNLGEYVSTSTGMLTVRQTDLSLPGRGLDLAITRVYTEPSGFINGTTINFESYPWAPLGDGWQVNFPWLNNIQKPLYVHLWNGEGYRVPSSFWNGVSGSFENHVGEHFLFLRNSTGIFLYTKSGVAYRFDTTNRNRLTQIIDPLGNNITFSYDSNNRISTISDTVRRVFLFCYNNGLLASINQTTGNCLSNAGSIRGVVYKYNGQNLVSVYDPLGRVTSYAYSAVSDPNVAPWLLSRITYPTNWFSSYSYTKFTLGTQATTYRVYLQSVNATAGIPGMTIRRFQDNCPRGPGDQVTHSFVLAYNGTSTVPASDTIYAFSFAGMTMNVTDGSRHFIRGLQQRFGAQGEVPREIVLVTNGSTIGSYTNVYRYDLWGNQIYSRKAVNPSPNLYHESFNAYYNDGLPPGFNAFQDSFSQNQGTLPDNQWSTFNGTWLVSNGVYNGTTPVVNPTHQEGFFAWTNFTSPSISMAASIYVTRRTYSSDPRVGLVAHYPGNGMRKWALVFHILPSGSTNLSLLDEYVAWRETPCTLSYNTWYRFNFTINGNQAWGSATAPGASPCSVSGSFTSNDITSATGLGLYAGGIGALFDNVTVTTVAPGITGTSFSNSFIQNGTPGPNVHDALAGSAELQNGTASAPVETYYGYTAWGGLNQTRRMYNSSSGVQWITTSAKYDTYGNLSTSTDRQGYTTYYSYSAKYDSAYLTNQTRIVISSGVTSLYGYNLTIGTMIWARDPNLNNVTYKYDILGRLINATYPNKDFTAHSYNDQANYVDIINENGWKTRQIYDGLGRLSITDRFLGGASYSNETYIYNLPDKETSSRDPLGNFYNYQFDAVGRLVLTTRPDGNTTRVTYDDLHSWVVYTDENRNNRCSISDFLGRLISVIEYSDTSCVPLALSGSTYVTNYYYNEMGNVARVSNAIGKSTSYSYDSLNRLTKTTYADGSFESYAYDNNGNVLVKTDRKGAQTSYAYDSLNRVTSVTYASAEQDTFYYDGDSNLHQLYSQNATLTYGYDSRNRVTSESYSVNPPSGGGSVAYGTLITLANRTGIPVQNLRVGMSLLSYDTATSQYDVSTLTRLDIVYTTNMLVIRTQDPLPLRVDNATAQRLYVKTFTGWTGWLPVTMLRVGDYLYNALDQHWTIVTSIELAPSGIHIMYDIYTTAPGDYIANGYLDPHKTGPTSPSSGAVSSSYSVSYVYSGEVLSTITYPDGFVAKYGSDLLGRVLNVTKSGTTTYYARFSYYQNDEVKGVQYGNGLLANYTYNRLGLLARETLNNTSTNPPTAFLILNYQYNKAATVASVVGNSTGTTGGLFTLKEQYSYDPLQRLNSSYVKSGGTTNTISYSYDNLGNRLQQVLNSQSTTYVYNPNNNELMSLTGGPSYSYDGNGNLMVKTQGTTNSTYMWDSANRLVKASSNGITQGTYAYDGLGRRVESVVSSTTFYACYGTETLSELVSGGATTDYLYAGGMRIGRASGITVNYYHTDALGSTRLVTSATQAGPFSDNYQPLCQDNGTPTGSDTYKFTGKTVSQTTGLYYHYHRWYDSSTGRFISADPAPGQLSNPQTLNMYVYAVDRPTSVVDPTGLDSCDPWNPFTYGGCFNNGIQAVNNLVVQPAENFVNNHLVKPIVNNVVVPLLNNVVVPLVLDYVAANNYINQQLYQAGNYLYNGYH